MQLRLEVLPVVLEWRYSCFWGFVLPNYLVLMNGQGLNVALYLL